MGITIVVVHLVLSEKPVGCIFAGYFFPAAVLCCAVFRFAVRPCTAPGVMSADFSHARQQVIRT
ncbi:hypothetical protein R1T44_09145 [Cobetia amphilecti]|uniref:hypothetical protein n=1 Tax=Cobetia amphilecti TaxID=1055104 RepID=UPI002942D5F7|nr:hypothetical protein [Cobetia amphilecti]WOI24331.1 hypothetical protein R1T44_09145 [Cobetia amphilecti]